MASLSYLRPCFKKNNNKYSQNFSLQIFSLKKIRVLDGSTCPAELPLPPPASLIPACDPSSRPQSSPSCSVMAQWQMAPVRTQPLAIVGYKDLPSIWAAIARKNLALHQLTLVSW